jgi:hypothetical protein
MIRGMFDCKVGINLLSDVARPEAYNFWVVVLHTFDTEMCKCVIKTRTAAPLNFIHATEKNQLGVVDSPI